MSEHITFDLGGTLINSIVGGLRPHAEDLVQDLQIIHRLELALWTSASRQTVDKVFRQMPWMKDYFSQIVTPEDFTKITLLDTLTPEQRSVVEQLRRDPISSRYVKIPPLVGSFTLVESDPGFQTRNLSVVFGFRIIDAASREDDPTPDAWAKRVAAAILGSSE